MSAQGSLHAKVLVTGADGFIGRAIVEALLLAGHEVVACTHRLSPRTDVPGVRRVAIDFREACAEAAWRPLLEGIGAVVNVAGILRETKGGDFERIHFGAPLALARACGERGGVKFVQVSALGEDADGPFIATKHRFDTELLASGVAATVIRPSVVLSTRGSYGGTSLLRALAALPRVVFLPGNGEQRIQPVLLEDLAAMVVRCVQPAVATGRVLHAVGPAVLTFREYLGLVRDWLALPAPVFVQVPMPAVTVAAWVGESAGAGPLGRTIAGMLERGNVAPRGAWEAAREATGIETRSVADVLRSAPSFVQDRWHARLYLLRPLVRASLAAIWVGSGIAGLLATPSEAAVFVGPLGVPAGWQAPLVVAASLLDIALGVALLTRRGEGVAIGLMFLCVVAYTLVLGVASPAVWLDPMGGVLKNLALLVLLPVHAAMRSPR